ncbi:MAG: tRNA pseudouridine(55) synthase TruB [Acidobacteriota bacterium]|nr:MAG: tRNA pseudouridine(55) synthase TruB [Acidobacteriota bacterium]
MNAVLLIDKPSGPTSHDIVARVRRILGEKRCGHTGTLDPFATGLLILCLGRATRLSRFLTSAFKSYVATIRFGYATDTYDRTGTPLGDVRDYEPERDALVRTLSSFEGRGMQRPPAFSAKKLDGKRLYQLAREGVPVTARPVEVEIQELELLDLEGGQARIRVTVSSGTYIRSLAHDVGEKLGVGAHLSELRRTAVASFSVSEAIDMDTLETLDGIDRQVGAGTSLLSPEDALRDLPSVEVGPDAARRLVNGQPPRWDELGSAWDAQTAPPHIRVLGPSGELLAVCGPDKRGIRPFVVWGQSAKTL